MKKKMIVTSATGIMLFSNLLAPSVQVLAAQESQSPTNAQVTPKTTTQSFTLKGYYDRPFAKIDVAKSNFRLQTYAIQPHSRFYSQVYASIKITRRRQTVFSKDFVGEESLSATQKDIVLEEGDIVKITHREANDTRFVASDSSLKGNTSGHYTYVVKNGQLSNITEQLAEATKAVNDLYTGDTPKLGITQAQADAAADKLNALPDYLTEKDELWTKLEKAYNAVSDQAQGFTLKGYYDRVFAQISVAKNNFHLQTLALQPHSRFYSEVYASIKITRGDQTIFSKDFVGEQPLAAEQKDIPLQNGDMVTITHREANDTRFAVTDKTLKNDTSGQYTYVVENGTLKLDPVTLQVKEASKAIDALFIGNTPKLGVTKEQADAVADKLNALPNFHPELDKLWNKLEKVYNAISVQEQTQGFILKGYNNTTFAQINVVKNSLHLQTLAVQPHWGFYSEVYASLQVKRGAQVVYKKDFIGNQTLTAEQKDISLKNGDIVTITHREANDTRFVVTNPALKGNTSGHYTYVVKNGQLDNLTSLITEATTAVNNLFNGNTPKPENTQEQLDAALEKIQDLPSDLSERSALQKKYDQAYLALNTYKKIMFTSPYPGNTAAAGIRMGEDHDRQDLGIQLAKGAKITIRQTNPKFTAQMTLRLLTNNSKTESSVNFTTNNVTLTAKDLAVPFVYTPYHQANGEKPKLEFSIEGQKLLLPVFSKNADVTAFKDTWNQTKGYALIKGKRFQTFLPEQNRNQTLKVDLNQLIDKYDNNIIGFYNELIGLSDNDPNPLNRASERRYFYKADASGPGALYYGGLWSAQTSTSADAWLGDGWGVLHETGHGYQGSFMNKGMDVGEVWNNLYGVIYNYKHMGKAAADKNSWLYDYGHKQTLENALRNIINSNDPKFNSQDVRKKLIILSNIVDKAGNEGFKNFYTSYRKFANEPGFNANNYLLPDLITTEMGAPKKVDFSAVLNAWGLTVSDKAKQTAKENDSQQVAHLAQVVPDNRLDEAIQQLTQNNRLSSVLSLVTNEELKPLNLKSNVTLNFKDGELSEGMKLRILDGKKLYKEVTLGKNPVTIKDMPNGVYALELETNTGYIQKPYLFVKNSGTMTISLNNYLKEATEAVNQLFQENDKQKIKTNLMQKDIDQVKKKINAAPDSSQKQALLAKLDDAFNQLQEFTFRGLGNSHFASFNVASGVATVRTIANTPHSYFTDRYASITIARNSKTIYQKEYIGDRHYDAKTDTIELKEGDLVTITHREANNTRLAINHANLKNNTNGTYRYDVKNGQLVLRK
ncbi:putative mucin/carbohydrate-binding domain-containing protein [Enterococcus villorum]|uniref:putative mucin/carbohydrate-binding domain-containing protein n=1 Tax=Enterococcus villorum TaxID=112904 RepID=UPI003F88C289